METTDIHAVLLRDIRSLLRLSLLETLESAKHAAFRGEEKQMQAYAAHASGASTREIARQVGGSHSTVGRWIDNWTAAGLVDSEGKTLLSPQLLGISGGE